jgi:hypothetical protein
MKKILLFLVTNVLTVSIQSILPPPPPPPPMLTTPPMMKSAVPAVAAPIMPQPPVPFKPVIPAQPVAPTPTPTPTPVPFRPGMPVQPTTTVGAPIQTAAPSAVKTDLQPIYIHNLSNQPATLTNATAIINGAPVTNPTPTINQTTRPISAGSVQLPANSKSTVHLSVHMPSTTTATAVDFGGYTSITIGTNAIPLIHPETKLNYFGSSTIYINNINGQWQKATKPVKPKPATTTLLKGVAQATKNISNQKKTQVPSNASKTIKDTVKAPAK